jgi:inhibitor of KinA
MSEFRVVPLGDACLSVVFEEKVDPVINARCVALAEGLERQAREGIRDIVPAYHAVAVYFDPRKLDRQILAGALAQAAAVHAPASHEDLPPFEVPVEYGGASGPDLSSVADFAGCAEDDVVRIHSGTVYRAYMLGFLPGFAYLSSVDPRIAMPRLETPRLRVQTGSVGIAGIQTGVYPCETPGGWRIIGRTSLRPYDPAREEPFLFKSGQRVKFVAA